MLEVTRLVNGKERKAILGVGGDTLGTARAWLRSRQVYGSRQVSSDPEVEGVLSYKLRPSMVPLGWLILLSPNPKLCCPSHVTDHITGHVGVPGITGLLKISPIPADK